MNGSTTGMKVQSPTIGAQPPQELSGKLPSEFATTLEQKLALLKEYRRHDGGHFTIFVFSGNVKILFHTPREDTVDLTDRLYHVPGFETITEAVDWALKQAELYRVMRGLEHPEGESDSVVFTIDPETDESIAPSFDEILHRIREGTEKWHELLRPKAVRP